MTSSILAILAMATTLASAASVAGPNQRALQSSGSVQDYTPTCTGTTDWLILLYVLGPLYAFVMAFTLWTIFVRDRRAGQNNEMNTAALECGLAHSGGESEGKGWFRKVDRPRSAWQASRTGRAGGGIDLQQIDRQIRLAFLRKVYAILSTQLLITMVIVIAFISASFEQFDPSQPTEFFFGMYNNPWVPLVALIPLIALICVLQCVKNSYPWNYIVLFAFTIVESCVLGIICSLYFGACYGDQVIMAAALTLGIFLALTAFTLQSRYDWSWLGPGLCAALFILFFWSFFTFFLMPYNGFRWQMLLSLLFALIFVGFIIYDTHMIMKYFGVDDFVIAAIELYLDVVNLFLFLLQFLAGSSD